MLYVMKLPTWFKTLWWGIVLITISALFSQRYSRVLSENPTPFDIALFIVWVSVLLAPIFTEIEFFGFKTRQEIRSLKTELGHQILNLQSEVRTSIRTEFNPQINLSGPISDSRLTQIEAEVKKALEQLPGVGIRQEFLPGEITVDDRVLFLFSVRFSIENELRRIWDINIEGPDVRTLNFMSILGDLTALDIISTEMGKAIKDVYTVCSPAIHGRRFSQSQYEFVKEVAPKVISGMKAISG